MTSSLMQQLGEPFPKELLRQLPKGGISLTYVPISEVIHRLNSVLGVGGWSYQVISVGRDQTDSDFVIAHVRLTIHIPDSERSVYFDALKKAATHAEVALDLARNEDALAYEEAEGRCSDDEVQQLQEMISKLSAEDKEALKKWWKGKKLPSVNVLPYDKFDEVLEQLKTYSKSEKTPEHTEDDPGRPFDD
jgi:hypothetical protein